MLELTKGIMTYHILHFISFHFLYLSKLFFFFFFF
jgi:hypothetical protein